MAAKEPMLLAGTLELLILRTLAGGPEHGYGIAKWIKDTSKETIAVEDRALYLALHRLETHHHITSEWALSENNRRAKYYSLTRRGRAQLTVQEAMFTRYARAVFDILRAPARRAPA